jgi:hypothetical protein
MKNLFFMAFVAFLALACQPKGAETHAHFTKADSLMDTYLELQDSVLQVWNMMINDDNHKLKKMKALVHELKVSGHNDPQRLTSLNEQIDQLWRVRFTQKSLNNLAVVDEYDFASNALISELTSLTESFEHFQKNTTIQNLLQDVHNADQRVINYRAEYDQIAQRYNAFLQAHANYLKEHDQSCSLDKKPVFEVVADLN